MESSIREFVDPRGLTVRAFDAQEVSSLETALVGVLGMGYDPLAHLRSRDDPHRSPMSFFLECIVCLSSMEARQIANGRELLAIVEARGLCRLPSEFGHLRACRCWAMQDFEGAHREWRCLLREAPRDILALYGIHMLEFTMGWSAHMAETIRMVAGAWQEDTPLFGYVKGIEAFALVENGAFDSASVAATRALRDNPRDIYAFHAACHISYENGQYESAIRWMQDRVADWSSNPCMRIHVWWHRALFHLYLMQVNEVLAIFRNKIRDKNNPDGYEDLDAVSLLWRLSLIGVDVSDLWQEIAQYWMPSIDQSQYWFNDVHAIMAMASSNHHVLVDRILRHIGSRYERLPQVAAVTQAVCRGLIAFTGGDYDTAVDTLGGVLGSASAIGGSNAQRDVLEMTVIEAALRCGRTDLARRLMLKGRSLRHPSALRDFYWTRVERGRLGDAGAQHRAGAGGEGHALPATKVLYAG